MMTELLSVRMDTREKHALRVLAAGENLNISEYVLKILREYTTLSQTALSLALDNPLEDQNNPTTVEQPTPEPA
jgi:hypothetical protein